MDYQAWITAVCGLLNYTVVDATTAEPTGVADFDNNWPRAVEYAENRMQRELDFLASIATTNGTMTANSRKVTYPTTGGLHYIVVSQITPIIGGVKQRPLEPVTRPFLDFTFPQEQSLGADINPIYWCPNDEASALVGPAPASALACEIVGTRRFVPLSDTDTSNFLTEQLPDLYLAASMIWWAGFQRDYGSQSDDPKLAVSWESQYQTLLSSAATEEARKKFADMYPRPTKPAGLTEQA